MKIKERNQKELFNKFMNKEIEYLKKHLKGKDMETAIKELECGIPVQYIVGNVDFYGNTFKVNKNTLIPRFETELLVEKTIKYINKYFNNEIKILDIGTGSGCIAITLNKLLDNSMVTAVDISKDALDVARENNKINNTDVNFIESDVFSNINDKYDVIISNPPYISYDEDIMDVVYNNEPHMALYADDNGLYFYDKILRECRKYLNDRFLIAFEIGYKQGNDILNIINKYFDNVNISLEKDYSGRDRFIFIWNHQFNTSDFYIDFYKKSIYNIIDLDFLNCLYFLVSAKVLQEVQQ